MILTAEQVTVIRAALQFWEEEMSPHGLDAGRGYFDAEVTEASVSCEAIRNLRRQLQLCDLSYLQISADGSFNPENEPEILNSAGGKIATLLR